MVQNISEMPQQARELAEKNVEQARTFYGQYMEAVTQAIGIWSKGIPDNQMTSGFKVVQDRAIGFAKQNAEAAFALAGDLAKAKDFKEMMSMQARYAQTQLQAYALQAQELSRLTTESMQGMHSPS
jgi:hypothetical protein